MPSSHQFCPDRVESRSHSLLHRQADDLESALPVDATTMRESKEVERFRLALYPTFAIGCGESTKLDQPRLLRIQGQPESGQSLLHCSQESSGCFFTLESEHTAVGIAHDNHIAPCIFATPLPRPWIKGIVQVDVRHQRRDHRALGVPFSAATLHPSSITPALSHLRISLSKRRFAMRCSRNFSTQS